MITAVRHVTLTCVNAQAVLGYSHLGSAHLKGIEGYAVDRSLV
jgi:hypothetical protein